MTQPQTPLTPKQTLTSKNQPLQPTPHLRPRLTTRKNGRGNKHRAGPGRLLILLSLSLLILSLLSLAWGQEGLDLDVVWRLITHQTSPGLNHILIHIRLPRILVCLLAGASLGLSGLLLQTLTKNPLADSGILGINTGAGLVLTCLLAFSVLEHPSIRAALPLLTMSGALMTVALVYGLSQRPGANLDPIQLIITGVGVSTSLSGLMIALMGNTNRYKVDLVVQWLSGKIQGDDWQTIGRIAPVLLLLWGLVLSRSKPLNIMGLNDFSAQALGLNLNRERRISLVLSTGLAGLSVVLVGNIAFVGLLAGNLTKHLVGNRHQLTLPLVMLIGALLLLVADTITRVWLVGTAIPTGLLVSIIGAPYFLYLLSQEK